MNDKVEHRCVVRVKTGCITARGGLRLIKDIYVLKRKSSGINILEEEISNAGAEDAIDNIINLSTVEDGIYEVIITDVGYEIESGSIDSYHLKLIPYDETEMLGTNPKPFPQCGH